MTDTDLDTMYQAVLRQNAASKPGVQMAIHTDETFKDESGFYLVLALSDGGYIPLQGFWTYETATDARADADRLNSEVFNLTSGEALNVVIDSMRSQGGFGG